MLKNAFLPTQYLYILYIHVHLLREYKNTHKYHVKLRKNNESKSA